jgi:hypothetical protein
VLTGCLQSKERSTKRIAGDDIYCYQQESDPVSLLLQQKHETRHHYHERHYALLDPEVAIAERIQDGSALEEEK